jgi:4-amino-4-deoxy-L-arabinose transferase-like glycosyltransferase
MARPSGRAPGTTTDDGPSDLASRGFAERLRFWRSPAGQPVWARPALLGIAALAAVLFSWNIADEQLSPYYSTAVRSMSVSWKAFLFGTVDPEATLTIDKLAGAFVPQALSARLFGYHPWALVLPQVIEGVVTVFVLYRIGRRWLGPQTGLAAAGLFTLTPVVASLFGHPMEDCLLVLCLVLAADSFQKALQRNALPPLLWCGVWIGLGFQVKMMQAWTVLPALALTYLIVAAGTVRRRLGHLSAAGAVTLAVSMSWLLLFAVVPAQHRPFVDGTTSNNPFVMAFGYNGVNRLGITLPGSAPSVFNPSDNGADFSRNAAEALGGTAVDQTWTKLVAAGFGSQIGWLYPLALTGLVIGLLRYRRAERTDPARAGFVLWGLWLLTFLAVFSVIVVPHTAYLSSLAPPVALLSAGGLVLAVRAVRERSTLRWALPLMIVLEVAWTLRLSSWHSSFLPWLSWGVLGAAVPSVVILVVLGLRTGTAPPEDPTASPEDRQGPRTRQSSVHGGLLPAAAALGIGAMIATPAAWSLSVLDPEHRGSAFDASAGPIPRMVEPGSFGATEKGPGPFGNVPRLEDLAEPTRTIAHYLLERREGRRYVAAVDSWYAIGPYIAATGREFLPLGGFSGNLPSPTLPETRRMVQDGELKYFLLTAFSLQPGTTFGYGVPAKGELPTIATWARTNCKDVTAQVLSTLAPPPTDQKAAPPADEEAGGGDGAGGGGGGLFLFECS